MLSFGQLPPFTGINGIALDSFNNVYVYNGSNSIINVYDEEGIFLRSWGSRGSGPGEFDNSNVTLAGFTQLAVDSNDQIYIADAANFRVQVLTSDGTFVRQWGNDVTESGHFNSNPNAIAIGPDDRVYVNADKLRLFDPAGSFTGRELPVTGRALAVSVDGLVFVGRINQINLQVADPQIIGAIPVSFRNFDDRGNPAAIAFDANGNLYYIDRENNRLADDTGTTPDGREFLYDRLGVRKPTQGEVDRALDGNFGFESVTLNSVVKDN